MSRRRGTVRDRLLDAVADLTCQAAAELLRGLADDLESPDWPLDDQAPVLRLVDASDGPS